MKSLMSMYSTVLKRWLLIKGRTKEAERVIRDAAAVNGIEMPPFTFRPIEENPGQQATYGDLVFQSSHVRITTILITSISLIYGFTYYGMVLLTGRIFETDNSTREGCSFDYQDIFINSTSEVLGVLYCAFVIDRMGRVKTQGLSYFAAGM